MNLYRLYFPDVILSITDLQLYMPAAVMVGSAIHLRGKTVIYAAAFSRQMNRFENNQPMLSVFPYHESVTSYLREQPALWAFFSTREHREDQLRSFKADLLKNTYQFSETAEPALFLQLAKAKDKLGLSLPVFLYQAENGLEANASIVYLQGEAHIVFSGNLLERMNESERLAIIAHELSHVLLYTALDGNVEIASRIVHALDGHLFATPVHQETARLFRLYSELFCDRGACLVTGDYVPVITSLVKLATGLSAVNADSYIKQAEEIFSLDSETRSSGSTHPENFIRARAIWLWQQQGESALPLIRQMLDQYRHLDELDLFKQQEITAATRWLIGRFLEQTDLQTDATLALARQYFPLFVAELSNETAVLVNSDFSSMPASINDYFAYVLYDFSTVDRNLEDVPLRRCFQIAASCGLEDAFAKVVRKEKKLTEKKLAALRQKLEKM